MTDRSITSRVVGFAPSPDLLAPAAHAALCRRGAGRLRSALGLPTVEEGSRPPDIIASLSSILGTATPSSSRLRNDRSTANSPLGCVAHSPSVFRRALEHIDRERLDDFQCASAKFTPSSAACTPFSGEAASAATSPATARSMRRSRLRHADWRRAGRRRAGRRR